MGVAALWLAAVAAVALAAPTALAGPPGKWTRITGAPVEAKNTDVIGLARAGDGTLHVAYTVDPPAGPDAVLHKAVSPNAKSLEGPHTIAQLESLNNQALIGRTVGGGLRAFFTGLTGAPGTDGFMRTATAGGDGTAWSPPAPASDATDEGVSSVYAATGIGAAPAADGTPVTIWGDSAPGVAGVHVGLDPNVPDTKLFPGENRCCVVWPSLALERKSGQFFAAWVNLLGSDTFMEVRQLGGPTLRVPNSGAAQLSDPAALAGRAGGGIYLAHVAGTNPFTGSPALWKFGAAKTKVIQGQRQGQHVGISTGPKGRMWVFWTRLGRLMATRTNRAATRFGAVVSPRMPRGAGSVYGVAGNGSRGPLDLFGLFERRGADLGYWHQRVLPGLSLNASRSKVAAGKRVTLTVTDAGEPVKGAKVRLRLGKRVLKGIASPKGTVKLVIPSGTRRGRYTASAARPGYEPARRKIRVG